MAKDDNGTTSYGAVENESYCMPSMEKRNTEEMNNAMGYHDMGDLANTKPYPVQMNDSPGVRRNMQEGPSMPNASMNDRKGKAY